MGLICADISRRVRRVLLGSAVAGESSLPVGIPPPCLERLIDVVCRAVPATSVQHVACHEIPFRLDSFPAVIRDLQRSRCGGVSVILNCPMRLTGFCAVTHQRTSDLRAFCQEFRLLRVLLGVGRSSRGTPVRSLTRFCAIKVH